MSTTPEPEVPDRPKVPDGPEATDHSCVNGKLFETCGTACPLTCDNYHGPPLPCLAMCVKGCFCPRGMLETSDGWCVPPFACPGELCLTLLDYYVHGPHHAFPLTNIKG